MSKKSSKDKKKSSHQTCVTFGHLLKILPGHNPKFLSWEHDLLIKYLKIYGPLYHTMGGDIWILEVINEHGQKRLENTGLNK